MTGADPGKEPALPQRTDQRPGGAAPFWLSGCSGVEQPFADRFLPRALSVSQADGPEIAVASHSVPGICVPMVFPQQAGSRKTNRVPGPRLFSPCRRAARRRGSCPRAYSPGRAGAVRRRAGGAAKPCIHPRPAAKRNRTARPERAEAYRAYPRQKRAPAMAFRFHRRSPICRSSRALRQRATARADALSPRRSSTK